LERPSALEGLAERGEDLAAVIDKVSEYAPAVAELMEVLAGVSDQITEERMDEIAEQSLDLRRTNMAIFVALLHDAGLGLGSMLASIDLAEWLGDEEAISGAMDAMDALAEALAAIAERIRPASRE
jgi:hypothetical protein